MFFDSLDLLITIRVFMCIVARGQLPIYLLGEIVDTITRLGQSVHSLYKWRQFITKLRKLKDVYSSTEEGGT